MAIAFRATDKSDSALAESVVLNMPVGTVESDFMIAMIACQGGTNASITPPSGWTLDRRNNSTTALAFATYYRVAQASEAGPYTFTLDTTRQCGGIIGSYSGVMTQNPVDASDGQVNASSTSCVAPTLTPTAENDWLLFCGGSNNQTTWAADAAMTERNETGGALAPDCELADEARTDLSATGTRTATLGAASVNIGHALLVKEATSSPVPAFVYRLMYRRKRKKYASKHNPARRRPGIKPKVFPPERPPAAPMTILIRERVRGDVSLIEEITGDASTLEAITGTVKLLEEI